MTTDFNKQSFNNLKNQLLMLDPVIFCQKYLKLEGKPFTLTGNGYKPFCDIYRYIGVKALEPTAKPVIIVKGRQVGATTMASALEMYFMGSGLFGQGDKPPIRIIHTFPQLEMAAAYSKTKLNQMIVTSASPEEAGINAPTKSSAAKPKSYMQLLLDQSAATNDSLHFKQFAGGNHLWVESIGLDADRIMGRSADIIFFDECFPKEQYIETINGKKTIGSLYKDFIKGKELPLVKTFNEQTSTFEYNKITNVWKKGKENLIQLNFGCRKIKCTPNHLFLTQDGWVQASKISPGTLVKSAIGSKKYTRTLNSDQYQVMLGSFLGDGHIAKVGQSRYRVKFTHGADQQEYCKWKADIFGSKSFGLNKELSKIKTTCPQWVLDELDERGLAVWFMDNGYSGAGRFSTHPFDEESQKRFVNKLKQFGIDCFYNYKLHDDCYYLMFNKDSYQKLSDLVRPYFHHSMNYKLTNSKSDVNYYQWNNKFENYCWNVLNSIIELNEKKEVYDIEVENNHNFILAPNTRGSSSDKGGPIAHNCQKTTGLALGNALKILTTAKYGEPSKGVRLYFGTPRRKGSDFHKMWQTSSQQYYYLGCEGCKEHFPLYTPGSDDWKKIWIYGKVVKCPHCGHEQDKLQAQERGKWVALKDSDDEDCKMIGFHINQLYMPMFTRESIDSEMPGKHPINTERVFMNEVLGEFFQGDSSPISPEEISALCGDRERKYSPRIITGQGLAQQLCVMGIDYGARADLEQLANPDKITARGQSYSTAVILLSKGPGLLSIEYAFKFKRNDPEHKKGIIDQAMKQYNVQLAVGDIGYSNDFSQTLYQIYGDRYLVSRAQPTVNDHVKFRADVIPKEIIFERDYYIGELYEQMKKGMIRFPYGDYERVAWLVEHCCSMEIKPSISRTGGDPSVHYVKGGTPNDGFMALLNAYLAYKFLVSRGFTQNNPLLQTEKNINKPMVMSGYVSRKF